MIKFINNIDNLLSFILEKKRVLICFYNNNCHNSNYLTSTFLNADLDIHITICLVDKYQFLNNNYNKLNSNYINHHFYNNNASLYYSKNLSQIVNSLSFLFYENINNLETPHIYFIDYVNNIITIKYSSTYYSNHDISNNILKLIHNFYNKSNEKVNTSNTYILESEELDNVKSSSVKLYI